MGSISCKEGPLFFILFQPSEKGFVWKSDMTPCYLLGPLQTRFPSRLVADIASFTTQVFEVGSRLQSSDD